MKSLIYSLALASLAMERAAAVMPFILSVPRMGTRYSRRPSNFHPSINWRTGKPHEHKREIDRRLRQSAARNA